MTKRKTNRMTKQFRIPYMTVTREDLPLPKGAAYKVTDEMMKQIAVKMSDYMMQTYSDDLASITDNYLGD